MNVEKSITKSLRYYPLIFKNRMYVLHHMFFVNGNGYEWKNGELVDTCDSFKGKKPKIPKELAEERRKISSYVMAYYPLSEYSKLNTIPDNVKPDWKAAAEETRLFFEKKSKMTKAELIEQVRGQVKKAIKVGIFSSNMTVKTIMAAMRPSTLAKKGNIIQVSSRLQIRIDMKLS